MSCYKRDLGIFIFISSLYAQEAHFTEELYILYALECVRHDITHEARAFYEKLYVHTHNYEYFIKYLRSSLATGDFKDIVKKVPSLLEKDIEEHELITRIYCVSLLNLNRADKALSVALKLLSEYTTALNYEVLANVYFVKKECTQAASYFETSYSMGTNSNTLFNLVNILYAHLNREAEALAYLETHVRWYGGDSIVCSKIVSIYHEHNNIEGVISV